MTTSNLHPVSKIILMCFLFAGFAVGSPTGETDLDACGFTEGFMYCRCSPDDVAEADDINCHIFMESNASAKEWQAVANLRNAKIIQFLMRPERILNYAIPSILFSNMKELHYFEVKMGHIEVMPSWGFSNSSSLSDIRMEDNKIVELQPFSFAYLANLTKLNLARNNIVEVNRNVFIRLGKVTHLTLRHNNIEIIHDRAFKDFRSLEDLELQNNNLSVITKDVFHGLKNLKRLDLRYNRIERLGENLFVDTPKLEDLDLSVNEIVSVSPSAFVGLKEILRLNMKDNHVVEFLPETFHHFSKMHFMDLRNNELQTFTKDLLAPVYFNFMNFTSIQFMLEGNRFKCDCRILWLQDLYKDTVSLNVRAHLNQTDCEFPITKPYRLSREEATRKNMPVILIEEDEDLDESTFSSAIVIPRSMNVMALAMEEFNCLPEETTTRAATMKSNGKNSNMGKNKNNAEAEQVIIIEKDAASLQNPEGRTESSSQSHQSNNINVPGSGSKVTLFEFNKWVFIVYFILLFY